MATEPDHDHAQKFAAYLLALPASGGDGDGEFAKGFSVNLARCYLEARQECERLRGQLKKADAAVLDAALNGPRPA